MRALVTTAPSGDPAEAERLAARCGLLAQPRRERSLEQLAAESAGAPVLVLASRRADLHLGGRSYRASPGLSLLRVARARLGEPDPLVRAAGLREGDRVLDATLGLGGDALVAAQATGADVVGLEASPVLAAFTLAALRRLPPRDAALGRLIEVRVARHGDALLELPARSFDVVLFDPMFRRAGEAAPLFDLVRTLAEHAPLRAHDLLEARRVARRGVLVKDAWPGAELARLRLTPLPARRLPRIVFGWAPAL